MPQIINSFRKLFRSNELEALQTFRRLGEWERVYHFHVRKTGGTSLNHMFLALASPFPKQAYDKLCRQPRHRVSINGAIYTGWNKSDICKGDYFYAFSHLPSHQLRLPPRTFTITCFRDPVKRVVSLYQMLSHYRDTGTDHPCMAKQGPWLGRNFDDFLTRIPREHLLNQLYMFSADYVVEEAITATAKLNYILFTDSLADDTKVLSKMTNLELRPLHIRKSAAGNRLNPASLQKLRRLLVEEYRFIDALKNSREKKETSLVQVLPED